MWCAKSGETFWINTVAATRSGCWTKTVLRFAHRLGPNRRRKMRTLRKRGMRVVRCKIMEVK